MANVLYPLAKKKFLDGDIDLLGDDIKISFLDDNATYNAAHEFYSSVEAAEVAVSANLGTKTTTGGRFSSATVEFTSVSGSPVEAYVIWMDTGTTSTSPIIAWVDTASGIPLTPNGNDVNMAVTEDGHFAI